MDKGTDKGMGMKNQVKCNRCKRRWVLILLLPLVTGCANSYKMTKDDLFMERWRKKAEATASYSPAAKPRTLATMREKEQDQKKGIYTGEQPLMPAMTQKPVITGIEKAEEKPLPTEPVSLKMSEVELGTLLRTLATAVGLNIMVNQSVKGTANINISEAPWDQVFKGLLATHSLSYGWEGDILRVITKEDFDNDLKLMEAKLKKLTLEKDKQGEINAIVEQVKLSEPMETRVFHVNYADPYKLKDNLTNFLVAMHTDIAEGQAATAGQPITAGDVNKGKTTAQATPDKKKEAKKLVRGTILVDEHTHSIIVQAAPSDMARLVPLIDVLDRPTRQIRIEAHIVEARSTVARQLGVQWGGLYHNQSGGDNYWIGPGQKPNYPNPADPDAIQMPPGIQNPWNPAYGVNFPADLFDKGLSVGYMAEALGDYPLAVQLTALQEDGALDILRTPPSPRWTTRRP